VSQPSIAMLAYRLGTLHGDIQRVSVHLRALGLQELPDALAKLEPLILDAVSDLQEKHEATLRG
jgi:fructose/tagatose bisphosphate aldolase